MSEERQRETERRCKDGKIGTKEIEEGEIEKEREILRHFTS